MGKVHLLCLLRLPGYLAGLHAEIASLGVFQVRLVNF